MGKGFKFKQFSIDDQGCGMPVSTDGVLLGAWADAGERHQILDIGTGSGLLALMMAQRFPTAQILAIDIDAHAAEAASMNAEQSAWANRIKVRQQDVTLWSEMPRFDTIVCNPPYFNSGEQAGDARRATARHTDTLSHDNLLKVIKAGLLPGGQAHLILPSVEADGLIANSAEHGLGCLRCTLVKPTPDKPVSRKLITLSTQTPDSCQQTSLVIRQGDNYSNDFIALTRDFYLKM